MAYDPPEKAGGSKPGPLAGAKMMNIQKLINARDSGTVRVVFVSRLDEDETLDEILPRLGLAAEPTRLQKVQRDEAIATIETLLWKDLAYHLENMPHEIARNYANEFIQDYAEDGCKIYSNGNWHKYHDTGVYSPMTQATFGGGIVIVNFSSVVCLWVEDED